MNLVHHHLLFQGQIQIDASKVSEESLRLFMLNLMKHIHMQQLISPQLKLSEHNAWTGIMGIVTSHISFHYWVEEQYLQLDIYSCKKFDRRKAVRFIEKFWMTGKSSFLFIDRGAEERFSITEMSVRGVSDLMVV